MRIFSLLVMQSISISSALAQYEVIRTPAVIAEMSDVLMLVGRFGECFLFEMLASDIRRRRGYEWTSLFHCEASISSANMLAHRKMSPVVLMVAELHWKILLTCTQNTSFLGCLYWT